MVGTSVGDNLTGLSSLTDTTGVASTIASDDEYFQYRQQLASTFTMVPGNIPSVEVAFGTTNAVGAIGNMTSNCNQSALPRDYTRLNPMLQLRLSNYFNLSFNLLSFSKALNS